MISIRFEEVCFNYDGSDTDVGALYKVSFYIPPGSVCALVGPSGAGKTTIRKILTGHYPITSGQIYIADKPIENWDRRQLNSLFSPVPQGDDAKMFSDTIASNIAFSKPSASQAEIERAASLAGIHDFIASLPDGYNTQIGDRGKRLSGGQKQRVALARAVLADRPIIFMDEATSAVDAITEREIQRSLSTILKGKTAIIIAHRLSTIWDIADNIIVLDKGAKVEEGTHLELVVKGGLYAKMVALQQSD